MPRKAVSFAALVFVLSPMGVATAANQSATLDPLVVVRASDSELRRLIREGHERSPTFRRLVDEIRQSRWLVFVQAGRCPEKAAVACLLHFVGAHEGARYMRILVTPHGRHPDNVIATLAHELQHAFEVVQEPGVTDGPTMRALFERIGRVSVQRATRTTYETAAARAAGERVRRDLERSANGGALHSGTGDRHRIESLNH